jgi:hypothetical protein
MAKTIFDYDSTDELLHQDSLNTSHILPKNKRKAPEPDTASPFDKEMAVRREMINDIQKLCKNKRLKKNILKFDYIRLGGVQTHGGKGYKPSLYSSTGPSLSKQFDALYNPSVTNSSSDQMKLPRLYNDPVIDY